ncbi:MAG TPA: hypothetical protein EYO97_00455 [Gemmatimonadetes bacterium]|jgi:hypothetical protein|nr:hypothetical protein [Gemmatimonadota bacterium]
MSEDDVTALETATSDFPIASGILSHLLYPRAAARSAGAIVKWWEKRRLSYNLIVGGGAGLSVVIGSLLWLLPPNDLPLEIIPLEGYLGFLFLINLSYSVGPATEFLAHKLWGTHVRPVGPTLFRMGLTFSLGLTLVLPLIVFMI